MRNEQFNAELSARLKSERETMAARQAAALADARKQARNANGQGSGKGSAAASALKDLAREACWGAIQDAGIDPKKIQTGYVANAIGENFQIFTDETIIADDKAFMLKIRDTVRAAALVLDEFRAGKVGKITIERA